MFSNHLDVVYTLNVVGILKVILADTCDDNCSMKATCFTVIREYGISSKITKETGYSYNMHV